MSSNPLKFVFFGSSEMSVSALDELEKAGLRPQVVVTTPDKPQGRKLVLTPNVVKQWAQAKGIVVLNPAKLDSDFMANLKLVTGSVTVDVFLVASYGKIIPKAVIEIPTYGTLNIHPSMLPLYRGASPLQNAMLDDAKKTGVTIMMIDELMDHGPIVAQKEVLIKEWPEYEVFEDMMAREGARMFVAVVEKWISGEVKPTDQDHAKATYTKKFIKEDGLLDLSADPYLNFRKIQAFHVWPQAYFMFEAGEKKLRVKITKATFGNGKLQIEKVIPEGGREMAYGDFVKGRAK